MDKVQNMPNLDSIALLADIISNEKIPKNEESHAKELSPKTNISEPYTRDQHSYTIYSTFTEKVVTKPNLLANKVDYNDYNDKHTFTETPSPCKVSNINNPPTNNNVDLRDKKNPDITDTYTFIPQRQIKHTGSLSPRKSSSQSEQLSVMNTRTNGSNSNMSPKDSGVYGNTWDYYKKPIKPTNNEKHSDRDNSNIQGHKVSSIVDTTSVSVNNTSYRNKKLGSNIVLENYTGISSKVFQTSNISKPPGTDDTLSEPPLGNGYSTPERTVNANDVKNLLSSSKVSYSNPWGITPVKRKFSFDYTESIPKKNLEKNNQTKSETSYYNQEKDSASTPTKANGNLYLYANESINKKIESENGSSRSSSENQTRENVNTDERDIVFSGTSDLECDSYNSKNTVKEMKVNEPPKKIFRIGEQDESGNKGKNYYFVDYSENSKMLTPKFRRSRNWSREETLLLLKEISETIKNLNPQKREMTLRSNLTFETIAKKLTENGYERNAQACLVRWRNVLRIYKTHRKSIIESGGDFSKHPFAYEIEKMYKNIFEITEDEAEKINHENPDLGIEGFSNSNQINSDVPIPEEKKDLNDNKVDPTPKVFQNINEHKYTNENNNTIQNITKKENSFNDFHFYNANETIIHRNNIKGNGSGVYITNSNNVGYNSFSPNINQYECGINGDENTLNMKKINQSRSKAYAYNNCSSSTPRNLYGIDTINSEMPKRSENFNKTQIQYTGDNKAQFQRFGHVEYQKARETHPKFYRGYENNHNSVNPIYHVSYQENVNGSSNETFAFKPTIDTIINRVSDTKKRQEENFYKENSSYKQRLFENESRNRERRVDREDYNVSRTSRGIAEEYPPYNYSGQQKMRNSMSLEDRLDALEKCIKLMTHDIYINSQIVKQSGTDINTLKKESESLKIKMREFSETKQN
ncbi:hypothetical protein BB559_004901 [Furculomyces boomerangus]|uniref:Myb-like domain-containing protein n=1 Tax=Furculomyces boomerangus TaxID=61424 RepID=A0A2T9YBX3_9FUNG|nr:hypothetical protein BB559_004901 [Furculomyces boomerangus]